MDIYRSGHVVLSGLSPRRLPGMLPETPSFHTMPTRRTTVRTAVSLLAASSLAGCLAAVPGAATFQAAPAVVRDASAVENATVLPTAASRIRVRQPVDPLGDVTGVSYGVTHLVGPDPSNPPDAAAGLPRLPILGEVLVLTTPRVQPPGLGERNPASDVTAETALARFGDLDVDTGGRPVAVRSRDLDDGGSFGHLLATAYRGLARRFSFEGPIERVDGVVRAEGTVTLAEPEPALADDNPLADLPVVFFGDRAETDDSIAFVLGWLAATEEASGLAALGGGLRQLRCPAADSTDGTGGCEERLASVVDDGLERFVQLSVDWVVVVTGALATGLEETRALLDRAESHADDGDEATLTAIAATRNELDEMARLNSAIREQASAMTLDGASKGPEAMEIRKRALEIGRIATAAVERIETVGLDVDGDGTDDDAVAARLDDLVHMVEVIDTSCSMDEQQAR